MSYVGDISYVGDTKSYVGDRSFGVAFRKLDSNLSRVSPTQHRSLGKL